MIGQASQHTPGLWYVAETLVYVYRIDFGALDDLLLTCGCL